MAFDEPGLPPAVPDPPLPPCPPIPEPLPLLLATVVVVLPPAPPEPPPTTVDPHAAIAMHATIEVIPRNQDLFVAYMGGTAEQSVCHEFCRDISKECADVGGRIVSIWHKDCSSVTSFTAKTIQPTRNFSIEGPKAANVRKTRRPSFGACARKGPSAMAAATRPRREGSSEERAFRGISPRS